MKRRRQPRAKVSGRTGHHHTAYYGIVLTDALSCGTR
jgi:hypothetical protein